MKTRLALSVGALTHWLAGASALSALAFAGCSSSDETPTIIRQQPENADAGAGSGGTGTGNIDPTPNAAGRSSTPIIDVPDAGPEVGGSGGVKVPTLPADFTATEKGGYKLGPQVIEVTSQGGAGGAGGSAGSSNAGAGGSRSITPPGEDCQSTIAGVVRDFRYSGELGGHTDFQTFWGGKSPTTGLVKPTLSPDLKPDFAGMPPQCAAAAYNCRQISSQAAFEQWYRNTNGVNQAYVAYFFLAPNDNLFTFESTLFFPLDNAGFGNVDTVELGKEVLGHDGKKHNFHFTTEIHTAFIYKGGEVFNFKGDDDVWVFINGRLALDLGGLHGDIPGSIDLNAQANTLGIEIGKSYTLDLFHAERRWPGSNFRIDTNLELTNCGTLPPDVQIPK